MSEAAAAPVEPTNGDADKKKGGKREERKRDETPIEELYDLAQPIPKVDKPNKAEHEKKLAEIDAALDVMKEERRKIQEQIDAAMNDPESKSRLQDLRSQMNQLKSQKTALIDQKKTMRAQLDQARNETEKLMKDKKDTKSNIRGFSSLEEIEKEIARLQRKQETTTMTLNEEKKLIKEMDALQGSKKYVADLKSKDAAMDGVKEQRKSIAEQIKAKDKEIDAFTPQIDEVMKKIKEINDKDTSKREAIKELFQKRDELKKQIGDKLKEKDALRDDFREKNNVWYNYQRAVRAQKKMQYEEEKKKREEEKAAYLAKLEEEEAKKIPYEEEQALCDYLADYLERTYLTGKSEGEQKSAKKDEVVAPKDDPFAGMKPMNKKEDDEYFGKGKGKKKRDRASKKQDTAVGPFTLSVDTFEQFGLINLTPPTSVDQVANSVKELREKKEWYKNQPRGSVPTAAEIRKANEKAAAKVRQQTDPTESVSQQGGQSKGNFSLSNDEFAPLGAGAASSSVNSSWGKPQAS